MNTRKANWLFLSIILTHLVVVLLLTVTSQFFTLSFFWNLILSELILLVPALLFLGISREKLPFHRMKPGTVGMVVLFTWLTMPLTTLVNIISMIFVDNRVMEASGDILDLPFAVVFFLMAVYGPVCEEIVFRGAVYGGYRKSGRRFRAMLLSGLLFGLMHMNLNQAAYAFVIGVLLAMLTEAAGSIWASVLYHVLFNAQSVCLMFLMKNLAPELLESAQETAALSGDMLYYSIGIYLILAAVGTTLAVMVLFWIAGHENRREIFRSAFTDKTEGRLVTVPLVIAMVICTVYMAADAFW